MVNRERMCFISLWLRFKACYNKNVQAMGIKGIMIQKSVYIIYLDKTK